MTNQHVAEELTANHERAIEQATGEQQFVAWIDGSAHEAESGATFEMRDPTTGTLITTVPECGEPEIDAAVEATRKGFENAWSALSHEERAG